MKTPLSSLRNLGAAMEKHGKAIGIDSAEALREMGYLEAYLRYKAAHPRFMNRMALYALYGALTDQDCLRLPKPVKDKLNAELADALKQQDITKKADIPLHILP